MPRVPGRTAATGDGCGVTGVTAVPEPRVPTAEWVGPRVCSVGAAMAAPVGRRRWRAEPAVMVEPAEPVEFSAEPLVMVGPAGPARQAVSARLAGPEELAGPAGPICKFRSAMAAPAELAVPVAWAVRVRARTGEQAVRVVPAGKTVRFGSVLAGLVPPAVSGVKAGQTGSVAMVVPAVRGATITPCCLVREGLVHPALLVVAGEWAAVAGLGEPVGLAEPTGRCGRGLLVMVRRVAAVVTVVLAGSAVLGVSAVPAEPTCKCFSDTAVPAVSAVAVETGVPVSQVLREAAQARLEWPEAPEEPEVRAERTLRCCSA